jgi:hypothetical protein
MSTQAALALTALRFGSNDWTLLFPFFLLDTAFCLHASARTKRSQRPTTGGENHAVVKSPLRLSRVYRSQPCCRLQGFGGGISQLPIAFCPDQRISRDEGTLIPEPVPASLLPGFWFTGQDVTPRAVPRFPSDSMPTSIHKETDHAPCLFLFRREFHCCRPSGDGRPGGRCVPGGTGGRAKQ